MGYKSEQIEQLKQYIFEIHNTIEKMNSEYERHFTMDGHLLGSAGEVFASYYYGIKLHEASYKVHDGIIDGKEVQIKITQRDSVEVKGNPQYLIVLKIEYTSDHMELYEVYNGPGSKALEGKNTNSNKEKSLSLKKLRDILAEEKIVAVNTIKRWEG